MKATHSHDKEKRNYIQILDECLDTFDKKIGKNWLPCV